MPSLSVIIGRVYMPIAVMIFLLGFSFGAWAGVVPKACLKDSVSFDERKIIFDWIGEPKENLDVEDQAALAVCALAVEDYATALESVNFVIGIDDVFPFAIELRGRIYMGLGRFPEAIDDFRRSVLLDSGSGDEYYYIAKSYYLDHRIEEALGTLRERVIYFDKQFPVSGNIPRESFEEVRIYSLLGEVIYASGDAGAALNILEGGYLRNTLSVELFDALMYIILDSGMKDKSDFYIEKYCSKPLIGSSVYCDG